MVVADTRGSGGSGGVRLIDLDVKEIEDLVQIANWIKTQFWSNKKVAMGGVSYDAMTGIKLAAHPQSPVDIVVSLFGPRKHTPHTSHTPHTPHTLRCI